MPSSILVYCPCPAHHKVKKLPSAHKQLELGFRDDEMMKDQWFQLSISTCANNVNKEVKVSAGEQLNIFPYAGKADVIFDSTLHYETPGQHMRKQPLPGLAGHVIDRFLLP